MQATIPVLKALRVLRGLSLKEIGAQCGIDQKSIQTWENGLIPLEKYRAKYAASLGITERRLMEIVNREIKIVEVTLK